MQYRVFSIPIVGAVDMQQEMNTFLQSHKVVNVEKQLVQCNEGCFWSFCVCYVDGYVGSNDGKPSQRKDYREELSPEEYAIFCMMRNTRKAIAAEDGVPVFAVFVDADLAAFAKLPSLSLASMLQAKEVNQKCRDKYCKRLYEGYLIQKQQLSAASQQQDNIQSLVPMQ